MTFSKIHFLSLGFLCLISTLISCEDDIGIVPIPLGSSVTISHTFQSIACTSGAELTIEDLFQVPTCSLAVTTNVRAILEFSAYLLNLYDSKENSSSFLLSIQADNQNYGTLFRVIRIAKLHS